MFLLSDDRPPIRQSWSAALRAVRRWRGLRPADVARAMPMALRSYEAFEAGQGRLTLKRLNRFAEVTDCDPCALVLCASLGCPELAVACADNKLMTILALRVLDLHEALGPDLAAMSPSAAISAADQLFETLRQAARRPAPAPEVTIKDLEDADAPLTDRQLECLEWAQAGKSSADIGQILGLSRRTVDEHLRAVCIRLGVRTRVQAVSAAINLGWLQP